MPTVTRKELRQQLAKEVGFFLEGVATGGSTSTIADTSSDGPDSYDDNVLTGKWAYVTTDAGGSGAAPEGEARKVSSVSTTTLTVNTNWSATTASGDTYELLAYHPNELHRATESAIRESYPSLYNPLIDETIIVDQRLTNGDFETFSGTFTGWAHTAGTWTQDTAVKRHSSNGAKGVASGSAAQLTQKIWDTDENPVLNITEIIGNTLTFKCWVYTTVASVARIRIDWDAGSTFENHDYHSGADQWELQEIVVVVPDGATQISLILEVAASNTAWFDLARVWIDPEISVYTLPSTFVTGPSRVFIQVDEDEPEGDWPALTKNVPVRSGMILRMVGMGRLTVPSTDAATTEVSDERARLLTHRAAQELYRRLAQDDPARSETHLANRDEHKTKADGLERRPGIAMRAISAHSSQAWSTGEDSGSRYLRLHR